MTTWQSCAFARKVDGQWSALPEAPLLHADLLRKLKADVPMRKADRVWLCWHHDGTVVAYKLPSGVSDKPFLSWARRMGFTQPAMR